MINVPHHPDFSKNSEKCKGDSYPCVVCGKVCRDPKWMVHLHGGGSVIVTEGEVNALDPSGDMSLYPLGSDCLRNHPELKPYAQDQRVKKSSIAISSECWPGKLGQRSEEMGLSPEQLAIVVNALEMRLQRCLDNNWLIEAEKITVILDKINEEKINANY